MMRCLVILLALAIPLRADLTADQVKAKVKEGADHFKAAQAATDKKKKGEELAAMNAALTAAFKEEKQDAAAAAQVETEAGAIDNAEARSLFFYFVCDAYCGLSRWKVALVYIDKAIALSKKPAYEQKKKEIQDHLK